jgi:uncharacterized protein YcbK (DUF882 family)
MRSNRSTPRPAADTPALQRTASWDRPPADHDPSRRRVLRTLGLGAVALGLSTAGLRPASAAVPGGTRTLVLHNTHTAETVRTAYCRDGSWCPDGLAAIEHVLRDHRTGDAHPIDRNLLDLLHDVAARCDRDPEFEVISGYRSPRTNAALHARSSGVATKSLHMQGRAIDIRLVGYDLRELRDVALGMQRGGVGYYAGSRFVHLDTGRVRTWTG